VHKKVFAVLNVKYAFHFQVLRISFVPIKREHAGLDHSSRRTAIRLLSKRAELVQVEKVVFEVLRVYVKAKQIQLLDCKRIRLFRFRCSAMSKMRNRRRSSEKLAPHSQATAHEKSNFRHVQLVGIFSVGLRDKSLVCKIVSS